MKITIYIEHGRKELPTPNHAPPITNTVICYLTG